MPLGLTNAPAVFQALVNDVLRDFLHHFIFFYLDNNFFPQNRQDNVLQVHLVVERLLEKRRNDISTLARFLLCEWAGVG